MQGAGAIHGRCSFGSERKRAGRQEVMGIALRTPQPHIWRYMYVDDSQRHARAAPAPDVQHVIRKAQEQHEADGGHGRVVVHQPGVRGLLHPDGPLLAATAQPAHEAADVVVVQQLKADYAQQEHAPHCQTTGLRHGPLAQWRAPFVQVLAADSARGCLGTHQWHQPLGGQETARADGGAGGQQQLRLGVPADLAEGQDRREEAHACQHAQLHRPGGLHGLTACAHMHARVGSHTHTQAHQG